jgi:DNA repair protein RadC
MAPTYLKRIVAHYVQEPDVPYFPALQSPADVVKHFRYLVTRDREEFLSLHLDKGNRPLCWDRVSVGTVSETLVSPREVIKTALISNATGLICLHNHPSGRVEPSAEDRWMTQRLIEAAALFGIQILDHIIVGSESTFYSFKENGLI